MSSAQDPFYIVKEEVQETIDKLQSAFHHWERVPSDNGEHAHLTKQLLANCESIEWQVDELDKTIAVAAKDPSLYGIKEVELDKRRRWTSTARAQVENGQKRIPSLQHKDFSKKIHYEKLLPSTNKVGAVKKAVLVGKENNVSIASANGMRRELLRLPDSNQSNRSDQYVSRDNDDYIASESDRQMLLIKRQDEELDQLSASVERIGGIGLTIHDELLAQDRIIGDLGTEMEGTSNRLDFVQKKVAMVMKKAGAKGQFMMILFLLLLFIILFVLVFLT